MAAKVFLIFVTVFAYVGSLAASPTRRQYKTITEATASDAPVTNDGAAWDDNDEFDLDGEGWFSQAAVSPSSAPQKAQEYNEYDDDYSRGNVMVEFGDDDEEEDEDEEHLQDAEEEDGSRNDSEFLFLPPRDTRLVLEDDDDDQSGPIKVRHTGRSNYPRTSETGDNSVESAEDDKDDDEHPYEFTIDEDDKEEEEEEDDDENEGGRKDDGSEEVLSRHENDDDEDEFVSEGDDSDMFDNPEEEAAQVIYGDHVFLY